LSIAFDDALKIARKSMGDMTGDLNPEVLRFDLQNGFNFRFRTGKGNYDITIDPNGSVGRFTREDASVPQSSAYPSSPPRSSRPSDQQHPGDRDYGARSPQGGITQQAAVEKALNHIGGGRVDKVKPSHGGWEIEISRGMMKGKMKVQVDADGAVRAEKRSRMDMMDFEFD
jgi:hypothetical protein